MTFRRRRCASIRPEISERFFEEAIACGLLRFGLDACPGDETQTRESGLPYAEAPPGGYLSRKSEEYLEIDLSLTIIGMNDEVPKLFGMETPLLETRKPRTA